ncbi:transporter substrate-binding domain-containing protein [Candidatus Symbiobacter mobilis]|uniref:transporter substrate-binding domain-containing diguanylate cyclase n=1 Tax=Candidatus Symbiobacter mobilis TaxID=1436290 RepID=UPI001930913D|nr:transporter substrate-binding domain-containing protein [Candidatus Symbiobacter mobilis]
MSPIVFAVFSLLALPFHSPPPAMLTRYLWLLALFLIGAMPAYAVDADTKAFVAKHPVVKIGVMADNEPYSMVRNGGVEGFSIDVLEELAQRTGLRFDYKVGSWPEVYAAFQRGDIDAIDEMSWSQERTAFTLFTEPYHHRRSVIMHDGNRPLPTIDRLEDLQPFRVGLVKDIFYKNSFTRRGIAVTEYDGLPNLIRALAFGWVDAIVGPEVTLAYLARNAGINHLVVASRVAMDGFELEDFRIGVRKELPQLHRILAAGLASIPRERLVKLLEVWQDFGGKTVATPTGFRLTAQQSNYLRRIGPVRVGIMRDYAPFSFVDGGKPQGLSVDVLARIQDLTGLSVVPVVDRWSVLLEMLQRGDIDVLANISRTPERQSLARFTDAYHVIPNVVFTRDPNFRINDLDDLSGLRIALSAGIFYEATLRQRFGDSIKAFASQEALFHALAAGDVDVVLASLHNGNHWVRTLHLNGIRIAGELQLPGYPGEDLRFGVRPALDPLADIMNKALAALSPTERRSIENRWLGATTFAQAPTSIQFSDTEKAWLAKRGKLVLCLDPDWMPLEGLDTYGRHVGIAADYLAAMTRSLAIPLEPLRTRTWQESTEAAQSRRCDMYSMAMQTPLRRMYMNFTTPYYTTPNVLIARIEAPFVEGLDEFADKRVGIVRGYAFAELLRARHPRLNLIEVTNEREGLHLLQRRELDGYIGSLTTINYSLRELGYADIKVIGRVPGDWALSLGTRNDEPELLSIAQKMVDSLTDADRRAIDQRWHSVRLEQKLDLTLVWQWGGAAALLLVMLFVWNRKLGSLNRQLEQANRQLAQLTLTDSLTDIGNRKFFDQEYARDFRLCQRQGLGLAVAMIDIDHFKQVNDQYGHAAGDECLRALARCLQEHLRRETDRCARMGGEEFVAFMPMDERADLLDRFEALRLAVEALVVESEETAIRFTISIGLAMGSPTHFDTSAEWLKRADDALYAAKKAGRNRVEVFASTASAEEQAK